MQLVGYRTSWLLESLLVEKHSSNKAGNLYSAPNVINVVNRMTSERKKKKEKSHTTNVFYQVTLDFIYLLNCLTA